ncbi:MAG: aminodeoxychorismate lyase [Frankiaceae bacterium]|nr:aminodeoxychorismate lyase [Arenimonas sp.]
MTAIVICDGVIVPQLDPADRGLAYGDGVFETLLVNKALPAWWHRHWNRLLRGATALGIPAPAEVAVRRACATLMKDASGPCVLKIICTRGASGRGYGPPASPVPTVIVSTHPQPEPIGPVTLRWCQMTWALQPRLAGIKHLNRLEQVLARSEWNDPDIFDGIVCDTEDRVVSATSGNLFAMIGGQWLTPRVDRCGIAGIVRGWLLDEVADARQADLSAAQVSHAEALFICNAVRGILPVRRLGLREWPVHPAITGLREKLLAANPAFVIEDS